MSTANVNFPTRPVGGEHPDAVAARHAKTLDEIRGIQQQNMLLADELSSAQREIQQLNDRISLLVEDNRTAKREAKIYMRKTVELATVMGQIGLMCRKGEEVVMSAGELLNAETNEEAETEKASAAEVVSRLPAAPERKPTLANITNQVERDLASV